MKRLRQTETFRRWERDLKDQRARAAVAARLFRLANGLLAAETRAHRLATSATRNNLRLNGKTELAEKLYDYDPAEALNSDEAIEVFLGDAFETGEARYIAAALGVVARAKGMTKIARETGLAREQLYKSLSENGNPTLETTLAVLKAIGFEMTGKRHAL